MKGRTWVVVAVAFAGLLLLLTLSLLATRSRAEEVYSQLDAINMRHRRTEGALRRLRSDIHLSGIFVRDYLLDTSPAAGPEYRSQLAALRDQTVAKLRELEGLVPPGQGVRLERLRAGIDEYWAAFDPVFGWSPVEKGARSLSFLRREVVPRREEVLNLAREMEDINDSSMSDQRAQVALRERELRGTVNRILWTSLGLGVLVALAAVGRLRALEALARMEQQRTARAEGEMRQLSQRLVRAQEDERRRLARELHDEVGQMLTALRMELGKAERDRSTSAHAFRSSIADGKRIIDTIMDSVRALSMGLRPAMLDDFGLGSALDWHVRDFSRRYGIPVFLSVQGEVDELPEPQRTCVYRIVQEALTNCAKHSGAKRVDVTVRDGGGHLRLSIRDDGVGLPGVAERRSGMGLVGMQERVREIAGSMCIRSAPGEGTALEIEIPHPGSGGGHDESAGG